MGVIPPGHLPDMPPRRKNEHTPYTFRGKYPKIPFFLQSRHRSIDLDRCVAHTL